MTFEQLPEFTYKEYIRVLNAIVSNIKFDRFITIHHIGKKFILRDYHETDEGDHSNTVTVDIMKMQIRNFYIFTYNEHELINDVYLYNFTDYSSMTRKFKNIIQQIS